MNTNFSRRSFLKQGMVLAAMASSLPAAAAGARKQKFRIGACDWSIGKSSDVAAFELAKTIGLQGLMVNMGDISNNLHLRNKEVQQQYKDAATRTGVAIASLAIGELNNYPYKSDPQTEQWVWDSVTVARNLGVPVVLLAFFHKNDLRNDSAGMKETIRRLKKVAPEAEKAGVILGVESYLDAAGHLEIIESVGSPNIKAYIDFRNTADAGYDVLKEVKLIGTKNICELHMKENQSLLGKGDLPWQKIRDLLYEMDYIGDGWMQIESSNPPNTNVADNYRHNLKFLQQLFKDRV